MTKFEDKWFSSGTNSKRFVDNWEKVFGKKCKDCGKKLWKEDGTLQNKCSECYKKDEE